MPVTRRAVLAERMKRQRLTEPLRNSRPYLELFRLLQPVSTLFFTSPGDPPSLAPRAAFDEAKAADRLRANRTIVKGRFLGGGIGYVMADELGLYAGAFQKPLGAMNETQSIVLEAVRSAGPLAPRQIKEETGILNKHIMPALHRLQEAFLVYEDQVGSDWERGWYDFEAEWPEVEIADRDAAACAVLMRFLEAHVFAAFEQIKDWSQLPASFLKPLLARMESSGDILPAQIESLGEGWLRAEDAGIAPAEMPPSVFMLHRADFLVRSHVSELKRRFGSADILQYLLIDGAFRGAVCGHRRIGPHDVDNIRLDLPPAEVRARQEDILRVVAGKYHPPHHRILAYDGEAVL